MTMRDAEIENYISTLLTAFRYSRQATILP